jgi:type I restriction enzyme R subunit
MGKSELPEKFSTDEYQILVVANKYQTGFDEPLLHTMYVDKRLSGVRAVQTLSRLNRQHPDKEDTLVLDFENDRQDILNSFERFYTTTTAVDEVDPEKINDVKHRIDEFGIVWQEDVDAVAEVVFQGHPRGADSGMINNHLDSAVDRFKAATDEERTDFRSLLGTFVRLYSFMAQVLPYADPELEKFFVYARLLREKLPSRRNEKTMDLDVEEVAGLEYYTTQQSGEGSLEPEGGEPVPGPDEVGTGEPTQQDLVELSQIIEVLNQKFGTDFDEEDEYLFDQVTERMASDEEVQKSADANDWEHFEEANWDKLKGEIVDRHGENQDIVTRIAQDDDFGETVVELLLKRVYEKAG